jgi:hypothetical protein
MQRNKRKKPTKGSLEIATPVGFLAVSEIGS